MTKKYRRRKKNIRRSAEYYAEKIRGTFANGRERRAWISDIVRNHPMLNKGTVKRDADGA